MKQRDTSLDLMRFIGVLVIMVAHSSPPGWLFQLRNFGTPLLIVTSALTYSTIYMDRALETKAFLAKRLKRLVLPAWIFLIVFYPLLFGITTLLDVEYPFSIRQIILTFPLYSGFVWIFKVYLILGLVTPLAIKTNKKNIPNTKYFASICLLYIAYEVVLYFTRPLIPGNLSDFFDTVIYISIPYSILYFYGFKLKEMSTDRIIYIVVGSIILFLALAGYQYFLNKEFVQTQSFKYPPRIYYLSYAFIAIHVFLLLSRKIVKYVNSNIVLWLSSKSLWIYLWHILAYYLLKIMDNRPAEENNLLSCILGSVFLLSFSVLLTLAQSFLVNKYMIANKNSIVREVGLLLV